ncbi:MAG: toxin-antitoxin system YwqK family antitoxin [Polyangiales bacterium]
MVSRRWLAACACVWLASCHRDDAARGPCPEGAKPVGAAPPEGSQLSCVLASNPSIKHGPFTEWWPGSTPPKKKREGAFKNGKLDGSWRTWYESGHPQREVTYVDGVLQGKHLEHHDDDKGTLKETGDYRDGVRIGVWQLFYENGVKERDLEHMPSGEQRWTLYGKTGKKVMTGAFVEGTKEGLFTEFYPEGQKASEGMWKRSKKDGHWTYWAADGHEIATEDYREGKVLSSTGNVPPRALPIGLEEPAAPTAGSAAAP